jgi:hypothetical protein
MSQPSYVQMKELYENLKDIQELNEIFCPEQLKIKPFKQMKKMPDCFSPFLEAADLAHKSGLNQPVKISPEILLLFSTIMYGIYK